MRKVPQISALILVTLLISVEARAGRIHPSVEQKMRSLPPGQKLAVIVEMTERANLAEVVAQNPAKLGKARRRDIVAALQSVAKRNQERILGLLAQFQSRGHAEGVIPFWIFNGFAVTANELVIRDLAALPEIQEIRLDFQIPLPKPAAGVTDAASSAREWNIDLIRAPEVWAIDPTYQGAGAVIGSFDSGVDISHPDLSSRYRGNHRISWFDPYGEHATPFDSNGHGTHTTGTAVGGDASGSSIGVAPGATWIAAKGWSDDGFSAASIFHRIFEWFLAPGGDPDSAPDVVNNSWAFDEAGCHAEFMSDIDAWRAAGIFPAFASGNEGPGAGTVRSPGAYPQSFAVGATDVLDEVAWFSGEGPSACSEVLKPNVTAPGDSIFSSVPGGYDILSGTSMATPHIAGAVAVLRSINQAMTVEELEYALTTGSRDIGYPGPDNTAGAGRLDLFVSAQIAIRGPNIPVVKVLASEPKATEAGAKVGSFVLSRTGSADSDLVVTFTVSGTAAPGSDYLPLPGNATIPAGSSSIMLQVVPVDDSLVELDESVILTLNPAKEYIVGGSDTAVVTVISDELVPDLSVTSLSAPATAGAGQSITLSDTTKNLGAGEAYPSVTKFYLSKDSMQDAADTLIASRSLPTLPAGAGSSGTTTATLPQQVAAGAWYIIARADADGAVPETSENNNSYSRSIQIGPDLVVPSLSAPATMGAGQSIAISETTKNQGGGAADASVTRYYLSSNSTLDASDLPLGSRNVPALAPGTDSPGTMTVTIPQNTASGSWYIIGKADADATVAETNENNNSFSRSVQIGPDLVFTALTAPTTAAAGQTISLSDTTKNSGGGLADASVTRYYLSSNSTLDTSDLPLGSRSVPALAPGTNSALSVTVTIPPGTAAGAWYIIAKTDADGAVAETSENNNTMARSIRIGS